MRIGRLKLRLRGRQSDYNKIKDAKSSTQIELSKVTPAPHQQKKPFVLGITPPTDDFYIF